MLAIVVLIAIIASLSPIDAFSVKHFKPTNDRLMLNAVVDRRSMIGFISGALVSVSSQIASAENIGLSLPNYGEATKNRNLDVDSELESENKKMVDKAKAGRMAYVDPLDAEMRELRKAEAELDAQMQLLTNKADVERKAKIQKDKAEDKENKWKTF